jgi:hypothetical protein
MEVFSEQLFNAEQLPSLKQKTKSDLDSNNASLLHLRKFILLKKNNENDENQICNEDFWYEFGMYMLTSAKRQNDNERFSASTAISYFGICKEYSLKKFHSNKFWLNHDGIKGGKNNGGGWYTKIVKAMDDFSIKRAISEGISLDNKSTPVGRFGVENLVIYCFKKIILKILKMFCMF